MDLGLVLSDKKICSCFHVKHVTPGAGLYFVPRGIIWSNLADVHKMMIQTRRFLKFSSRKFIFSLYDLDMQQTKTILTIIKEGHIWKIPARFGQNQLEV